MDEDIIKGGEPPKKKKNWWDEHADFKGWLRWDFRSLNSARRNAQQLSRVFFRLQLHALY